VVCCKIQRLASAGAVETMLLDKTGTLTEQGLEMVGILPLPLLLNFPAALASLEPLEAGRGSSALHGHDRFAASEAQYKELQLVLALAHSVRCCPRGPTTQSADVEQGCPEEGGGERDGERDGDLVGQELELGMVRAARQAGWSYDWSARPFLSGNHAVYGPVQVLKSFGFDSETMTMSVVVRGPEGGLHVLCKGSAEAICKRSQIGSALELGTTSERLASTGYYVVACAHRLLGRGKSDMDIDMDTLQRTDAEQELLPVGALVFRNELKSDAVQRIADLQRGGIAVAMVTGDHILTGIAVARTAGILPKGQELWLGDVDGGGHLRWRHAESGAEKPLKAIPWVSSLAITGAAFDSLRNERRQALQELLRPLGQEFGGPAIRVFARMSPEQKVAVVECYQALGQVVGFCGDGSNDSGALRTAHVGLAFSGCAEASVAPCSTSSSSLKVLVRLLAEGRASLYNSIAALHFLVVKGLIFSLGSTMLLVHKGGYISPVSCLYLDVLVVPFFLWTIMQTLPRSYVLGDAADGGIAPQLQEHSSLGLGTPCIWIVVAVDMMFYYLVMAILDAQIFYRPLDTHAVPLHEWSRRTDSYEAEVTTLWMSWCIVDVALLMSHGGAHRAPLTANRPVLIGAGVCHMLQLALLFGLDASLCCSFKINCKAETYEGLTSSMLNMVLFNYEKLGGSFNAPEGSNVLGLGFRWGLLCLFLLTSVGNHCAYFIIEGILSCGANFPGAILKQCDSRSPAMVQTRGDAGGLREVALAQPGLDPLPRMPELEPQTYGRRAEVGAAALPAAS